MARKARDSVTGGGRLGAEIEGKRWTEEMKETRSVINGTHPNLAALEDKELRRRKAKYSAPALGDLTYKRQKGTFRFVMNQVDNMSTINVRVIKMDQLTRLVNRYNADT